MFFAFFSPGVRADSTQRVRREGRGVGGWYIFKVTFTVHDTFFFSDTPSFLIAILQCHDVIWDDRLITPFLCDKTHYVGRVHVLVYECVM